MISGFGRAKFHTRPLISFYGRDDADAKLAVLTSPAAFLTLFSLFLHSFISIFGLHLFLLSLSLSLSLALLRQEEKQPETWSLVLINMRQGGLGSRERFIRVEDANVFQGACCHDAVTGSTGCKVLSGGGLVDFTLRLGRGASRARLVSSMMTKPPLLMGYNVYQVELPSRTGDAFVEEGSTAAFSGMHQCVVQSISFNDRGFQSCFFPFSFFSFL